MATLLASLLRRLIGYPSRRPASSGTLHPEQDAVQYEIGTGAVVDGKTVPSNPLSEGEPRTMNLKELVDTISQETSIPAGQVKKVTTAVLEKFCELIDKQESFRSPVIYFNTKIRPAQPAEGGKPARSEQKIATMMVKPSEE